MQFFIVGAQLWCWWIAVVSISSLVYARAPKVTGCQCNFWLSVPSSDADELLLFLCLLYSMSKPRKWLAGRWWSDCLVAWSPSSWFIDSPYEKLYVNPKFLAVSYFFVYCLITIFFSHFISVCIQTQLHLSFRLERVDNLSTLLTVHKTLYEYHCLQDLIKQHALSFRLYLT